MAVDNEPKHQTNSDAVSPENDSEAKKFVEKIAVWACRYAEKNGWVLNPGGEECAVLLQGLARKRVRSGKQYCPCRIRSGDPETGRTIICPSICHRDEIVKDGHCHCRLFFRKDAVTVPGVSE